MHELSTVYQPRTFDHPYDLVLAACRDRNLTSRQGCRDGADKARVVCPAHPDRRPSLSITRASDRVLLHCFGGCAYGEVIAALGLHPAALFNGPRHAQVRPEPIATYEYVSVEGELVARKVRFSNKTFRWQRPGKGKDAWISNLNGVSPGLYRLPELADSQVFLCEGEKAVDLLWSLGITATCGPAGASTWRHEWSRDLAAVGCRELFILPDADKPGQKHAANVAEITHAQVGQAIAIKVVRLPGLAAGADVFDWLRAERSGLDLLDYAYGVETWRPGAEKEASLQRKRVLAAERQRRLRARRRPTLPRNAVNVLTFQSLRRNA